jgi:hypothetical protein
VRVLSVRLYINPKFRKSQTFELDLERRITRFFRYRYRLLYKPRINLLHNFTLYVLTVSGFASKPRLQYFVIICALI